MLVVLVVPVQAKDQLLRRSTNLSGRMMFFGDYWNIGYSRFCVVFNGFLDLFFFFISVSKDSIYDYLIANCNRKFNEKLVSNKIQN